MDHNKQTQGQPGGHQDQRNPSQSDDARKNQQAKDAPQGQGRREDEGKRLQEDEPTGRAGSGWAQSDEDRT